MIGGNGFLIFSVYNINEIPSLNYKNSLEVENFLQNLGIAFKVVKGCYKGQVENSYVVSSKHETKILELAADYNQESILQVDAVKNSSLRFLRDGSIERLGKFVKVEKEEALELDNYTYDFHTSSYFVVK
jgi:hypothetical protein